MARKRRREIQLKQSPGESVAIVIRNEDAERSYIRYQTDIPVRALFARYNQANRTDPRVTSFFYKGSLITPDASCDLLGIGHMSTILVKTVGANSAAYPKANFWWDGWTCSRKAKQVEQKWIEWMQKIGIHEDICRGYLFFPFWVSLESQDLGGKSIWTQICGSVRIKEFCAAWRNNAESLNTPSSTSILDEYIGKRCIKLRTGPSTSFWLGKETEVEEESVTSLMKALERLLYRQIHGATTVHTRIALVLCGNEDCPYGEAIKRISKPLEVKLGSIPYNKLKQAKSNKFMPVFNKMC